MATRRSKRTAGGPKLSNFIDELTTQAKLAVPGDKRAAREAKYADTKPQFDFLELLPELRLRIYAFAMATKEPRELKTLRMPTLALVSKQVRAECLPVFFSECEFAADVTTNYPHADDLDAMASEGRLTFQDLRRQRSRAFIPTRDAGRVAIVAKTSDYLANLQSRENILVAFRLHPEKRLLARIHIPTATKARPVFSYADSEVAEEILGVLQKMRDASEKLAEEVARREHFVGLTVEDLEGIVKPYRYLPEGARGFGCS